MSEFTEFPIPLKTPAQVAAQLAAAVVTPDSVNAAIGDMSSTEQDTARIGIGAHPNDGPLLVVGRKPPLHVVITDDDCGGEVMTHLLPILQCDTAAMDALGLSTGALSYDPVPCSEAAITNSLTIGAVGGHLTWAQAATLRDDYGWEFTTHGRDHDSATLEDTPGTDTWEEAQQNYLDCKTVLLANGHHARNHIYLFNGNDHRFHAYLRGQGVRGAMATGIANAKRNVLPLASMTIARYLMQGADSSLGLDGTAMTTLAQWQAAFDLALAEPDGDVFGIALHAHHANFKTVSTMQLLADFIHWIQQKSEYASGDIVFSTLDAMMDANENLIEAGLNLNGVFLTAKDELAVAGSVAISKTGAMRLPGAGIFRKIAPTGLTAASPVTAFPRNQVTVFTGYVGQIGSTWPTFPPAGTAVGTEGTILTNRLGNYDGGAFQEFYPKTLGSLLAQRFPYFARRVWLSDHGSGAQWSAWQWFTGNVGRYLVASGTYTPGTVVTISAGASYQYDLSISGISGYPSSKHDIYPTGTGLDSLSSGLTWRARPKYNSNASRLTFTNSTASDITLPTDVSWKVDVFQSIGII